MHMSSLEKMSAFVTTHLAARRGVETTILDIGSTDVNGSYKPFFADPQWRYLGLDLEPGNNVDIVAKSPYRWDAVASASVDVVVSGQAFEHIEFFWLTALEIERVLRPGGVGCILAPSGGPEHRYPQDCWRFYPDGMRAIAKFAKLEVVDASTVWEPPPYPDGCEIWKDSQLIFRKPAHGGRPAWKRWLLQHLIN
jgi:SAM-dependent methyltransferase